MSDTSHSYMTYISWLNEVHSRLTSYAEYRDNKGKMKDVDLMNNLNNMRTKLVDEIPFYIKFDDGYEKWCRHVQNEFANVLTSHVLFMAARIKIKNISINK